MARLCPTPDSPLQIIAFKHGSSALMAAGAGAGKSAVMVTDPFSESKLASVQPWRALPRDHGLLAKLGLVHSDLEANFPESVTTLSHSWWISSKTHPLLVCVPSRCGHSALAVLQGAWHFSK